MVYVELRFPLLGAALPCDHGQAIFCAIARLIPEAASAGWLLMKDEHRARRTSSALREVAPEGLRMRLPQSRIARVLELAHRRLRVGGQPVRLGTPEISLLYPCSSLYARRVVINGCSSPEAFLDALCWRLDQMGIACEVEVGRRERLRAGRRNVFGFALTLHGLSEEDSVMLQEQGLGNHRHFGCGFFVPAFKHGKDRY